MNELVQIKFAGYRDESDWPHYAWHVVINGRSFEYKTGVGNATSKELKQGKWPRKPQDKQTLVCQDTNAWVHIPKADDVLHCLFLDAEAGEGSFYDFCDNMGYDRDSIKALDTYRACMENASKLRIALGDKYASEQKRIQELEL